MPHEIDLSSYGISAVILAAGKSSRMGSKHKLRLVLADGRSVLQHAVAQALSWNPVRCVVVLQPTMLDSASENPDKTIDLIVNPEYDSGMSSSLRYGINALGNESSAALVLLGDQPQVDDFIIRRLLYVYETQQKPITAPMYGAQLGPPTLFSRVVFPELLALTGDQGARPVVQRDPTRVAIAQLLAEAQPLDIDTPDDYQRYLRSNQPS